MSKPISQPKNQDQQKDFYQKWDWGAWFNSSDVMSLPKDIQSTWFTMLGRMFMNNDEQGYLSCSKKTPNSAEMCAMLGFGDITLYSVSVRKEIIKTMQNHVKILENKKLFSRDERGIIFSRRIVRDLEKRRNSIKNGSSGGSPILTGLTKIKKEVNVKDNLSLSLGYPERNYNYNYNSLGKDKERSVRIKGSDGGTGEEREKGEEERKREGDYENEGLLSGLWNRFEKIRQENRKPLDGLSRTLLSEKLTKISDGNILKKIEVLKFAVINQHNDFYYMPPRQAPGTESGERSFSKIPKGKTSIDNAEHYDPDKDGPLATAEEIEEMLNSSTIGIGKKIPDENN